MALIVSGADDGALDEILAAYLKESTYYFNVAVWIERCRFAPQPLRTIYRSELASRLG